MIAGLAFSSLSMTTPSQPSFTHALLPSPSLSELSEHSIGIHSQNLGLKPSLHICTLCQQTFSSRPFSFPSTAPAALATIRTSLPSQSPSQAFCQSCWLRIYTLSLCWTCGEIVSRSEERVSFGWCWWHWGCVNCVFCRVPQLSPRFRAWSLIHVLLLRHLSSRRHGLETAEARASWSRLCVDSASEVSTTSNRRPLRKLPDPSQSGWPTYHRIASKRIPLPSRPLLLSLQASAHRPSRLHSHPTNRLLWYPSPNHL